MSLTCSIETRRSVCSRSVQVPVGTGSWTRRRRHLFPTEHHFAASYTGSAPLDASSGNNTRHWLNTDGNRALTLGAPHHRHLPAPRAAEAKDYYQRKIAEGKNALNPVEPS